MPTIRFSDLVKKFGQPELKSLWADPNKDKVFLQTVKQGRVLTLSQEPNSQRKDSGKVGFQTKPHAAYLIFPKSLKIDANTKVVGIKYDLIREATVKDPVPANALNNKKKGSARFSPKPKKIPREPRLQSFEIRIRRTATIEKTLPVSARNKADAIKVALEAADNESFEGKNAKIETKFLNVRHNRIS